MSRPALDDLKRARDGHLRPYGRRIVLTESERADDVRAAVVGISHCGCVPCIAVERRKGERGPDREQMEAEAGVWARTGLQVEWLSAADALARFRAAPAEGCKKCRPWAFRPARSYAVPASAGDVLVPGGEG